MKMKEIIVILDNVRSALNVGAIFRTCEGAGVEKIILGGITAFPPHNKIAKTALGAEKTVPFEHIKTGLVERINDLKEEGYEIISIEESPTANKFYNTDTRNKVALVFGHEITGVSLEVQEASDQILELPMLGKKKSLNVATTAGIVIYNLKFGK